MPTKVRTKLLIGIVFVLAAAASLLIATSAGAQDRPKPAPPSPFAPVIEEPFDVVLKRDKANKPRVMAAAMRLLEERYDLTRRVDANTKMTRGKPVPVGPTARLKGGVTWEQLGRMSPDEIRDKNLFPIFLCPTLTIPLAA